MNLIWGQARIHSKFKTTQVQIARQRPEEEERVGRKKKRQRQNWNKV